MLVFRGHSGVTLWTVDTLALRPQIIQVDCDRWVPHGDTISPAIFFPHTYFRQIPMNPKALIPLAVHAVRMAKSDYVDGVQVGIFTQDKFELLNDDELKPHIELSEQLDSEILKRLTMREIT
jgi:hypothetical protein